MANVSLSSKFPDLIRRRYRKAKELAQPIFDQKERNRNLYRGTLFPDENYEWDYALVDPLVFPVIRNYLSRSNPSQIKLQLDHRRPEDLEKKQINQLFLNWELNELPLTSLFYRLLFSAYINGRGYLKTGWKYEPATRIEIKDEFGNIVETKIMKDIVNRADAKFVRFTDILVPNRNIPFLEEQPFVIELLQMRLGDMIDENEMLEERGEKPYWKKEWIQKLRKAGVTTKLLDYQVDILSDEDTKDELAFRSSYVSLICMQTIDNDVYYLPLEEDDTIINTSTVGRYWHGHYPYISFAPFLEDDEYYCPSIVDVIGDLQIAATEILNQTLTNIRAINTDMWIAGTGAAQTPDWQFQKRPNGIIRVVGDVSQVQQVRTQDNTRSALVVAQDLATKIEKASGISSYYASGATDKHVNQTARGAQIIDQNIETNMRMIVDLFGEQVLKTLGEHFLELNAQYVREEQVFAVTGRKGAKDFIAISPEQISANFDVSVNSERMLRQTPASRQASLQNFANLLLQYQNVGGVQVDLTPVVEALADAYPEMENIDAIVVSLDEKIKRDISYLERGQLPEIKVRDPHEELVSAINVHYAENQQRYPEEIRQVFEEYVKKHLLYAQSIKEANMWSQPQLPQQANAGNMTTLLEEQLKNAETQGMVGGTTEGKVFTYNLGKIV